jgi:CheY-like chemotaxis protein
MIDAFATAESATGAQRLTVLVVEDEVLVRAMISEELRLQGCVVIEASNGDEAVAVLRTSVPIDAVFTDMRMPGKTDGAALVHLIRTDFPHIKVVMVAGQLPQEQTCALLDGYISKPFAPSQLSEFLRSLTTSAKGRI